MPGCRGFPVTSAALIDEKYWRLSAVNHTDHPPRTYLTAYSHISINVMREREFQRSLNVAQGHHAQDSQMTSDFSAFSKEVEQAQAAVSQSATTDDKNEL